MMPEIKKILYATDLSPNSAFALLFALSTASHHHAEIVILHVFDEPVIGYAPMLNYYVDAENLQSLYDEHAEKIQELISRRFEMICTTEKKNHPEYKDLTHSIEICKGFSAETILNKADELNCDMIIMGTHGKGVLGHTFLGSTAKRVLRRTRKPIFVIPLPKGKQDITFDDEMEV